MLAIIRFRTFCLLGCCPKKNLKIGIYKTIILPVILYGCETCCDVMVSCRVLWISNLKSNLLLQTLCHMIVRKGDTLECHCSILVIGEIPYFVNIFSGLS
jgi:hypothetical protein